MRKTVLCLMLILSLSLLPSYSRGQVEPIIEIVWHDARFAVPYVSIGPNAYSNVYALAPSSQYERGGIEWEIVLRQKPLGNIFQFAFQSSNLIWYYQAPLNEELNPLDYDLLNETHAIKDKQVVTYRPINVVGSYAVYHSSKQNNEYGTGKIFHLYRIHLVDAVGNEAWGEYNKDVQTAGYLKITLPQKFLDIAVYPVTIDPSFGNTGTGSSGTTLASSSGETIKGIVATGAEGTADSITVRLARANPGSNDAKCALYLNSDSTKHAETEEKNINFATGYTYYWFTFNFEAPKPSISAIDYVIVAGADYTNKDIYIRYDSGSGKSDDITYPTFPDTASFSDNSQYYSIYCNYTVGGGQDLKFDLPESVAITATLDETKALLFSNTESAIPSSLLDYGKEKGFYCSESVSVNSAIDQFKEFLFSMSETFVISATLEMFEEIAGGIEKSFEFIETVVIEPTLEQMKELAFTLSETVVITPSMDFTSEIYEGIEKVFTFIETVAVNSVIDQSAEIKITFFEFLEPVEVQAYMYPTLPEIPPEVVEYGIIGMALAIVAIAFAITFSGKTE